MRIESGSGMTARVGGLLLALVSVVTLAFLFPPDVGAQDEMPEEISVPDIPEAAVPIPNDPPPDPDPEWSYRFLVPATMLLGTVAVVGATIMYFIRVTRKRYRVVK